MSHYACRSMSFLIVRIVGNMKIKVLGLRVQQAAVIHRADENLGNMNSNDKWHTSPLHWSNKIRQRSNQYGCQQMEKQRSLICGKIIIYPDNKFCFMLDCAIVIHSGSITLIPGQFSASVMTGDSGLLRTEIFPCKAVIWHSEVFTVLQNKVKPVQFTNVHHEKLGKID